MATLGRVVSGVVHAVPILVGIDRDTLPVLIVSTVGSAVLFAGIAGAYFWRVKHAEHVVATIEDVWEEARSRGSTVSVAELSFTRRTPKGTSVVCRVVVGIGAPSYGYKIGDKLDVVPRTGTCSRPFVIGRAE